jgi:hypothetical protein
MMNGTEFDHQKEYLAKVILGPLSGSISRKRAEAFGGNDAGLFIDGNELIG